MGCLSGRVLPSPSSESAPPTPPGLPAASVVTLPHADQGSWLSSGRVTSPLPATQSAQVKVPDPLHCKLYYLPIPFNPICFQLICPVDITPCNTN